MTKEVLFLTLREKFEKIVREQGLLEKSVKVSCRALSPQEAIGDTERKDFPILSGRDIMIQAEFEGGIGQAFTNTPAVFGGSIKDVLAMDIINNDYDRGIFIAVLNAVMRRFQMCEMSIHCKDNGPEDCARKAADYLWETYGNIKIAQIGYQPAILERISERFDQVRVLDLDPENVGDVRYGVKVLDGIKDYESAVLEWADLVLCTGSTLGNGSIVNFLDIGKEVLFYGTTAAGAAALMGWKRLCFAD